MFLTAFPDIQWLKSKIDTDFADGVGWKNIALKTKGWPSVVLEVQGQKTCRRNIKGPVSIFSNTSGTSTISTDNQSKTIGSDRIFISNQDQVYTLETEPTTSVFNIHLGTALMQEITAMYAVGSERILDGCSLPVPEFYNYSIPKDALFSTLCNRLKQSTNLREDALAYEAHMFNMALYLLQINKQDHRYWSNIPAVKNSTQKEVYKKLRIATDFMESTLEDKVDLDQLALHSGISKYHFLRLFKNTFKITPHQYLTQLRIGKAVHYLNKTKNTAQEIAMDIGLDNASSLTRLLRNHLGHGPNEIRKNKISNFGQGNIG